MGPYQSWKKYCRHCKQFLLDYLFRPSDLRQAGISVLCRNCSKKLHAKHYALHPEKYKARSLANRQKNGAWIKAAKVEVVVHVGDFDNIVLKF